MFYLCEFELYEDGEYTIAEPFGLGSGTFGEGREDALESAADYMRVAIEDMLIEGKEIPEPTLGNEARHGGMVVVLAVDCSLDKVDAVTASEAARMLNISRARVTQMCDSGKLQSWKEGSKRMVTRDSIKARLAEQPKAGRPRKELALA